MATIEIDEKRALAMLPSHALPLFQRTDVQWELEEFTSSHAVFAGDPVDFPFFTHTADRKELRGCKELVIPSLQPLAFARHLARLRPEQEDPQAARAMLKQLETNLVIRQRVPVLLNTADVAHRHTQNPFRELYKICGFRFSTASQEMLAAIPKCCREEPWVIDTTLRHVLCNSNGTFVGYDSKEALQSLNGADEDFMRLYEHMWPGVVLRSESEEVTYSDTQLAENPGGSIFAVGYLEFLLDPVQARKITDLESDSAVWPDHVFLAVRRIPVVDLLITNLPLLTAVSHALASAGVDAATSRRNAGKRADADALVVPLELLPLSVHFATESKCPKEDLEWLFNSWPGRCDDIDVDEKNSHPFHKHVASWFTETPVTHFPRQRAAMYCMHLFMTFASTCMPTWLVREINMMKPTTVTRLVHTTGVKALPKQDALDAQAAEIADAMNAVVSGMFAPALSAPHTWYSRDSSLGVLSNLPQLTPLVLATRLVCENVDDDFVVETLDEIATAAQNALSSIPKAVAITCLCARVLVRVCKHLHKLLADVPV